MRERGLKTRHSQLTLRYQQINQFLILIKLADSAKKFVSTEVDLIQQIQTRSQTITL